jgi:hypothetical protein
MSKIRNEDINEEIFSENKLMRQLVEELEIKVKTLELIKDKLIIILDDCKCDTNKGLKQEVQLLIDNYHKLNQLNNKSKQQKNNKTINKNNSKIKTLKKLKKSIENEEKSEIKAENNEKMIKSKTGSYVCDWIGCDFETNTKRRLILHQGIHRSGIH